MPHKNIEIEMKFPLKNSFTLVKKLNKLAKADKKDFYQKDIYYIPAHRNFLKQKGGVNEWLRIRETNRSFSINYKNWHRYKDGKTYHCDEYESVIENGDALKRIFKSLNFEKVIIVDKTRNTWFYKDCEVAIDKVIDLGEYLEIEAKRDFRNIGEAKKHIYKILKEIGAEVGEQDFVGYPYRLLEKQGYKFEGKK